MAKHVFWKPYGQTAKLELVLPSTTKSTGENYLRGGRTTEGRTIPAFSDTVASEWSKSLQEGSLDLLKQEQLQASHKLKEERSNFVPENFKECPWIIQQIDTFYILSFPGGSVVKN